MTACNNEKKADTGDTKDANLSSTESKEDRNKKVIMASFESFEKGDMDAVFKDAAPNFTDYADGSVPPITSIDSIKQFFNMITTAFEGYKGENLKYYADGDYVLVHGDWGGVFKNDFMGIKATGKPFKFKDVDIFKLNEEGKITEHSSVQNLGAVLMATGTMK
jgi:ketosteroid isomerase-like protein